MNPSTRDLSVSIASASRIIFTLSHLRRTLLIMAIVGLLLSFINDGEQILCGPWDGVLIGKVIMNFFTPFAVANLGLLARHSGN